MVTFAYIQQQESIQEYIRASDAVLEAIGFTEHGFAHAGRTAEVSHYILQRLGYEAHSCTLAQIAGYTHDIGNMVNRHDHAQSGAVMAFTLLRELGLPPADVCAITTAIGHHDEATAAAISPIAAALILADKSDVRRSRVRGKGKGLPALDDIHDRVNYAVRKSQLTVDADQRLIILTLQIETEICPVMDYFEIFIDRMVLCRKSAEYLHCDFELIINDTRLL